MPTLLFRFSANAKAILIGFILLMIPAKADIWQWSAPTSNGRAFLWIPTNCQQIRGVVVAQNNRAELGILEHPEMRKTLVQLGFAEVWICPPFDNVFRFDQGAGDRFNAIIKSLADVSGYSELTDVPLVPLGDGLSASFPWNLAAWNPERTLAAISVHGDAPLTDTTSTGLPNPPWGKRTMDGVPGLMVMGEYEWNENRILPALRFRLEYPKTPLAMLAEPGHGHFDVSDELVGFLASFIRRSAEERLPPIVKLNEPLVLTPVNPATGWLVQRWSLNQRRTEQSAPASKYKGKAADAFWCFDQKMADAITSYGARQIGRKPQLLGFTQEGSLVPSNDSTEQVDLRFLPEADGVTFKIKPTFLNRVEPGCINFVRWTGLPENTPIGHVADDNSISVAKLSGPVQQLGPNTFTLAFDRNAETVDSRNDTIWFIATQAGDSVYKRIVQQALMHISPNIFGKEQHITFSQIPNQTVGSGTVPLNGVSDAGMPVSYYVREGPAYLEGTNLMLSSIPPRAKFPVEVTVVAWQWGRSSNPIIKTAQPVERTFQIFR